MHESPQNAQSQVVVWSDRSGAVFSAELDTLIKVQENKERATAENNSNNTLETIVEVDGKKEDIVEEIEDEEKDEKDEEKDEEDRKDAALILGHCSWITTMVCD
jgi:hypothetical protein